MPALIELLKKAIDTIEGLADQQAMPDHFYEEPLAELKNALKEAEDASPDT